MFLLLHWRQAIDFLKVLLIFFFSGLGWLEIMHRGHTWHATCDLEWPWNDYRRWFRKFTERFRPIRKEIIIIMYNNNNYQFLKGKEHSASSESCSLVWQSNSLFSKLVIFSHVFVPLSKYVSEDQKYFARQKLGCFPLCQKSISNVPFYQSVSLH